MRRMLILLVTVVCVAGCSGNAAPMSRMVIHRGDKVRASGSIQMDDGRPTRFCAPGIELAVWPPSPCRHYVIAEGVNVEALEGLQREEGMAFGRAQLEGTLVDGVLHVERQSPPTDRGTVYRLGGNGNIQMIRDFAHDPSNEVAFFTADPNPRVTLVKLTRERAKQLSRPEYGGLTVEIWLVPIR